MTPRMLNSGSQPESYYRNLWSAILAGEVHRSELVDKTKSGKIFYIEQTISPVKNEDGNITHFISTSRDITHRKKMEADLKNIAWTQSHIVRAPLARLMALIHFLDETDSPEFTHAQAKIEILKSANELDNIIQEIAQKSHFLKD